LEDRLLEPLLSIIELERGRRKLVNIHVAGPGGHDLDEVTVINLVLVEDHLTYAFGVRFAPNFSQNFPGTAV